MKENQQFDSTGAAASAKNEGRIEAAFAAEAGRNTEKRNQNGGILNVYFTAGFPEKDDTLRIAKALERGGADMIEIGMPFSDPIADGSTIQESSARALVNGMNIPILFEQLTDLRKHVQLPVLLMGYLNPILQYGMERFLSDCKRVGIDGLIIPDLPLQEYLEHYELYFRENGLRNVFLISPNTSEERIRAIDRHSTGFVYMVATAGTTGARAGIGDSQLAYFERIDKMGLEKPRLIGFGISDKESFETSCRYADGAIIGSAFINQLKADAGDDEIEGFVKSIIGR